MTDRGKREIYNRGRQFAFEECAQEIAALRAKLRRTQKELKEIKLMLQISQMRMGRLT